MWPEGVEAVTQVATALTIALGVIGPSIAIGWIGRQAMESIGRNPESASSILTNMILVVAFAEAIAIYALIVAMAIKFV